MSDAWAFGLIVALVVVGVRAVGVALWGPRARARRRLRGAPKVLVDGATVTLEGLVRASAPLLEAPLTGRACVLYRVRCLISERRGNRRVVIHHLVDDRMVPFVLETLHGPVLVDEGVIELELSTAPIVPRDLDREAAFLRAHGHGKRTLDLVSFEELAIEPGRAIAAHGVVIVEPDPDPQAAGYRDASYRVRLVAQPPLTFGRARSIRRRRA